MTTREWAFCRPARSLSIRRSRRTSTRCFRVRTVTRSVSLADNVRTVDIPPSMSWLPGEPFGYLTITGLVTEMAGDFRLPRNDHLNNFQIGDTIFLTRGKHAARFGFQGQYIQFDQ